MNARDTAYGVTALIIAASNSENPEVVKRLVSSGAHVNLQDKTSGMTPLMWAAMQMTPEVVTALLDAGADAKMKTGSGKMAIDYAKDNYKVKGTDAYRRLQSASK